MPKIDLCYFDDWMGLYLDGKLVYEDHTIDSPELLDYLSIPHTVHWFDNDTLRTQFNYRMPERVDALLPFEGE